MALQELQHSSKHPYICGYKEFFVTWDKEVSTISCLILWLSLKWTQEICAPKVSMKGPVGSLFGIIPTTQQRVTSPEVATDRDSHTGTLIQWKDLLNRLLLPRTKQSWVCALPGNYHRKSNFKRINLSHKLYHALQPSFDFEHSTISL